MHTAVRQCLHCALLFTAVQYRGVQYSSADCRPTTTHNPHTRQPTQKLGAKKIDQASVSSEHTYITLVGRGIQSSVKKYMYSGTNVHRVYLNSQQSYTSAQLYVPPHSIHNTKTYQIPCSYDNIQIVGRLSTVNRTGITMRIVLLLTLSM